MMLKVVSLYMLMGVSLADSLGCFSSLPSGTKLQDTFMYQSADHCTSMCPGSPYIAFKNGNECYCLDTMPSSSATGCNTKCTGFGDQTCGGSNVYQVYTGPGGGSASAAASSNSQPSSTSSSSLPASTSSSSPSSSSSSSTSSRETSTTVTSSGSSGDRLVTVTKSTSSSTQTSFSEASTTPSSSSSSTSSSSASANPTSSSSRRSTNVGPIVGGVVGGIAAIALIGVGIFLCLRYRRDDDDDDEEEFYDTKPSALGRGNTSKGSKRTKTSPLDMPMSNPFVHPSDATAGAPHNNSGIPGLQNVASGPSGLMDPRLNPIMMGRRRLSEGSLADEADYSRKILHVANPDA